LSDSSLEVRKGVHGHRNIFALIIYLGIKRHPACVENSECRLCLPVRKSV